MTVILIRIIVVLAVLFLGRKFLKYCQQTLKTWLLLTDQQKDQEIDNYFGGVIMGIIDVLVIGGGIYFFGEGALWPSFMISVLCVPLFSEIMGWEYLHNTPFFLGGMTVLIIVLFVIIMIESDRCGFC